MEASLFRRGWFLAVLCGLATACASGGGSSSGSTVLLPESNAFDGGTSVAGGFINQPSSLRDSVLEQPRNRIWTVMPAVFETLDIATPTVNAPAYLIGNPSTRVTRIEGTRLSSFLDCGSGVLGPNADRYEVTMQLMVQLAPNPDGGTLVRTTMDAYARPRDTAGEPLHCASQRTLERRIMQLIQAELSGAGPRGPVREASQGRIPAPGDVLRVQCVSPLGPERPVAEGVFVGGGEGSVSLGLDAAARTVEIPVTHVGSVQIREQRSRAVPASVVGGILGAVAGGYVGRGWYNPDAENVHYGQGVYMTVGAVLGLVGGALTGRIIGSFIRFDTWHDAPRDWAARYEAPTQLPPEADVQPVDCPSF